MSTSARHHEVIIIGGSYAGLSAALTLGRSLRDTLIIDSGLPCNRTAPHSHNFITQDGVKPTEIAATALQQVLQYPSVRIEHDLVSILSGSDTEFTLSTASGKTYTASKVLLAMGVKDLIPELPGFKDCWGISAIHCPYCHGYEARGQKAAIWTNGEEALRFGQLIKHWNKELTILTNGTPDFDTSQLDSLDIQLIDQPLQALLHTEGQLSAIVFADGSQLSLEVLYHRPAFAQHGDLAIAVGCELNEQGYIAVEQFQQTAVPGIYAAGDCTTPFRSVAQAVSQGNIAAAMLNHELIMAP